MASKRNQARNEKALQELLRTVPGNDRCADCQARNPGWASWSLGIFLCMRCAALHRKLGTHISKVKSLSMDSWSNEQVENMEKVGNVKSNKLYNPQNKQPAIPADADEVDGALEKFIRQKYDHKVFASGLSSSQFQIRTASTTASPAATPTNEWLGPEDDPPLPQKKGKRFGFGLRSASSTLHLGRKKTKDRNASMPAGSVIGATIGLKEEGMEWKLVTLRDMGFRDERRNTEVLRGLNGDLERAIESLVRLGQGTSGAAVSRKPSMTFFRNKDGAIPSEAQPPSSFPSSRGGGFGVSIYQSPQHTGVSTAQSSSSSLGVRKMSHNPFDNIPAPKAQSQQQSNIEQAFSNMTIAQPMSSQSTGILPSQQAAQQAFYQQSMTPPPMPQNQQQYTYNPFMQQQQSQQQPQQPYLQQQTTGYNSFMQAQAPQAAPTSNPFMSPQIGQNGANPFTPIQQVQPGSNPFFQQANTSAYSNNMVFQQQQQQQSSAQQQLNTTHPPTTYQDFHTDTPNGQQQQLMQQAPQQGQIYGAQNPFQQQPQQGQAYGYQNFSQQQQQQSYIQPQMQPLMTQPTGRLNKSNIMALYNQQPALPPSIPEHSEQSSPIPVPVQQPPQPIPQRSVTMPTALHGSSNNPFGAPSPSQTTPGARVRDSIFAGTADPFASLSAKVV